MIDKLKELLKKHEGLRLKPYRDTVGKLTIGVGRNLDDVGITNEEAEYLLGNDISNALEACRKQFIWFEKLSDNRKIVILDMSFNMGISGLLEFRRTLKYIEDGKFEEAAKEMLDSKWSIQVGQRATELSNMLREG